MNELALSRSTTPTITIRFRTVDPASIIKSWLTLRQKNAGAVIDRDLTSATRAEDTLSWQLTQEETAALSDQYPVEIQCRYLLNNGVAGASPVYTVTTQKILREGVIG